jgi:hypothetical protein
MQRSSVGCSVAQKGAVLLIRVPLSCVVMCWFAVWQARVLLYLGSAPHEYTFCSSERTSDEKNQETLACIVNAMQNVGKPGKNWSGIGIFPLVNCVSLASAFRHRCQFGIAGHGLVRFAQLCLQVDKICAYGPFDPIQSSKAVILSKFLLVYFFRGCQGEV